MHADQAWIITAAVLTVTGIVGWAFDRYVLVWSWWPLIGPDWRAQRFIDRVAAECEANGPYPDDEPEEQDWADELRVINLAVSHKVESVFQRRLVLVSEVTHYEIEAVIKDLGRADWLPERWKAAA